MSPGDAAGTSGVCNGALPNASTYARFLWVVKFFTANGFYVLIDNHLSYDDTAVTNPTQARGTAAGYMFPVPPACDRTPLACVCLSRAGRL